MQFTASEQSDAAVVVYEYGLRIDPTPGNRAKLNEHLDDQMWRAHRLYNEVVAVIRSTCQAAREWLETQSPEAKEVRLKIDALTERYKIAKAADDRAGCEAIAQERRTLWRTYYGHMHTARTTHKAAFNALLAPIGNKTGCATYDLRNRYAQEGLETFAANAELESALQAYKKQWPKLKLPNFRQAAELTQRRVRLQFTQPGGLPVARLLAAHATLNLVVGEAGQRKYGEFTARIGCHGNKQGVTGTIHYHRPLPPDASIATADIVERRIGKDRRYYLQLVVKLATPVTQPASEARQPLLALDFGWYFEEDGRRIAGATDGPDPSEAWIIRLPQEVEGHFGRAEHHGNQRDTARDELVAELKAVEFSGAPEDALKDELTAIAKLPAQHIAASRLVRLARTWRSEASSYLPSWLDRLEQWAKADRLAWQAQSHARRKAIEYRNTWYEGQALDLAKRYERIVIDTPDLAQTAKVKDKTTGKHNKLGATARSGRHLVALSVFRDKLLWAAARTGGTVVNITGRTTRTCSHCGSSNVTPLETEAQARDLLCGDCGAIVDREANAAAVVWQAATANHERVELEVARVRLEAQAKRDKRRAKHGLRSAAVSEAAQRRRADAELEQEPGPIRAPASD